MAAGAAANEMTNLDYKPEKRGMWAFDKMWAIRATYGLVAKVLVDKLRKFVFL